MDLAAELQKICASEINIRMGWMSPLRRLDPRELCDRTQIESPGAGTLRHPNSALFRVRAAQEIEHLSLSEQRTRKLHRAANNSDTMAGM